MYQATDIMTPEEIDRHLREIQPFTEAEYNADVPAAVVDRAVTLEAYLALSSKLVADAKYRYREQMAGVFVRALKENTNMQTSTLNKYLDNLCRDLAYLVDWTDRLNRTITHELDFCRTLISKLKEEAKLAGNSNW